MKQNIVVIKYGGAAMHSPALNKAAMQDIVQLKKLGLHPIIVHGGGAEISKMCQNLGIAPTFVNGLRVTDQETLAVVQMVLIGKINKQLVSWLTQEGGKAVGLSGLDGALLHAKQAHPDLGFVGEIESVNPAILYTLMQASYIPVVAPLACSSTHQNYNINADTAAAALATAFKASQLVLLTDVPGVLSQPQDPSSKIDRIKSSQIDALIESGTLKGGMIPKILAAQSALQGDVKQVHIMDGTAPHTLLAQLHEKVNQGTTVYV